ncbi:hypothetical protein ACHAWU_002636 [Discostella pseudostelligera]|uniref:Uncharacterized protein n=1 Tax=Discostella pseudostelligera TaxID=259834 RepID=A0ABD3LXB9_9STRA
MSMVDEFFTHQVKQPLARFGAMGDSDRTESVDAEKKAEEHDVPDETTYYLYLHGDLT